MTTDNDAPLRNSLELGNRNPNRYRALHSVIFGFVTLLFLFISLGILIGILSLLFINGLPAINFEFLTQQAKEFGAEGGILFQIIGSLIMVFSAAILAFPISYGLAIFIGECIQSTVIQKKLLSALHTLNAVPSIAYGIFGLIFFVYVIRTGISWFIGAIILAFMMLPTVTVACYQAIRVIPVAYREQAFALGFNRSQLIRFVILPKSMHGAITGLMIGVAATVGETAPIMFIATAFSGVTFPSGFLEPVSTLPTHILALAQQATNPQALNNAWGAALILIFIVLGFSIVSLSLRIRLTNFRNL